jgi:hypothetical protein
MDFHIWKLLWSGLQDKVNYCDVEEIDDIGNTMKFYETQQYCIPIIIQAL